MRNPSRTLFDFDQQLPWEFATPNELAQDDQNAITYFNKIEKNLAEALYLADVSRPERCNLLHYRCGIPAFYNFVIREFFPSTEIEPKDDEGKSYDWLMHQLNKKRISVKTLRERVLPRPYSRGYGYTKPKAIQLKNTRNCKTSRRGNSNVLGGEEFDYLLVTCTTETAIDLYLLTMRQVQELLKRGPDYRCDENGFDGSGQIHLFLESTDDCLWHGSAEIREFGDKYHSISAAERNVLWEKDQYQAVKDQIDLTRQGVRP